VGITKSEELKFVSDGQRHEGSMRITFFCYGYIHSFVGTPYNNDCRKRKRKRTSQMLKEDPV
jgi:hypothetical protein